jgi:hypothetical protein
MAHAAATEMAAETRISRLEEALQRLSSPSGTRARPPTSAGPARPCHRCGSSEHLVRHCPHPPIGAKPTYQGASPFSVHGGRWLLDSGTTHHMSSGGTRGASAFVAISSLTSLLWFNLASVGLWHRQLASVSWLCWSRSVRWRSSCSRTCCILVLSASSTISRDGRAFLPGHITCYQGKGLC